MEQKTKFKPHTGIYSGKVWTAILLILSGALLFARNMGWITPELFSIIVSWQSLLIVIGIFSMIHRHYLTGILMAVIGGYFMVGGLAWLPQNYEVMIWPLVLILLGAFFLFKSRHRHGFNKVNRHGRRGDWNGIHGVELTDTNEP